MKRTIYIYTCMNCGLEWESSSKDVVCPICKVADIHEEVEENDDKDTL